ncbi:hypothetical protein DLM45_03535 [Hyphomicrobium methylovorum]|uniref:DUF3617 domain-containing protein n=1 Tax=Hyphomicrobium methylovorum TaxID=84 RepID=UPI0015E78BA3|nr:DUF3617 family protein [Hyphomicrobium methylovorum]MBA2125295.1 hypothetical protein [Hyphomicrobium methylovorum]
MKSAAILSLSVGLFILPHFAIAEGVTVPLPVRKPGHWQITTVAQSIGMKTFDACLTESDNIVTGTEDPNCGKPDVKRIHDEIFVNVVCKTANGTQKISSLLTGDFQTWYRSISKVTFDPPQDGVPHMGATIDGKFIGPTCDEKTIEQPATKK